MSRPARDAAVATVVLLLAIYLGSGRLAHLDPALFGYLGASVAAFGGAVFRASAFWRRPSSAFYARTLVAELRHPARLHGVLRSASSALLAQTFVLRRSRLRWLAHVLLSLGTLASFAITVPLVFGWVRFVAVGPTRYRAVLFTIPTASFAVDGAIGWLAFHALAVAGGAVAVGALAFLVQRLHQRAVVGKLGSFHTAPLLLLLVVAATGLALPATRRLPALFDVAALAHELAVIVLLAAIPFSKLHHVLIRPLQLGARLVRASDEPRLGCADCGAALAPAAQRAALRALLAARGVAFAAHGDRCPSCRRRRLATSQAALVGAHFHPPVLGAHPAPRATRRAA
jgi:hypothetical protein